MLFGADRCNETSSRKGNTTPSWDVHGHDSTNREVRGFVAEDHLGVFLMRDCRSLFLRHRTIFLRTAFHVHGISYQQKWPKATEICRSRSFDLLQDQRTRSFAGVLQEG